MYSLHVNWQSLSLIFNGHEFLTMRGALSGVAFNKALKGLESAPLNLSCSAQLFSFLQRFMGGLMRHNAPVAVFVSVGIVCDPVSPGWLLVGGKFAGVCQTVLRV